MPRFFFHIYDGFAALDLEGTELPNWRAAHAAAIQHMGEVLQHDANRIRPGEDWHMEVTDAQGLILFRLDFSVIISAALNGGAAVAVRSGLLE